MSVCSRSPSPSPPFSITPLLPLHLPSPSLLPYLLYSLPSPLLSLLSHSPSHLSLLLLSLSLQYIIIHTCGLIHKAPVTPWRLTEQLQCSKTKLLTVEEGVSAFLHPQKQIKSACTTTLLNTLLPPLLHSIPNLVQVLTLWTKFSRCTPHTGDHFQNV